MPIDAIPAEQMVASLQAVGVPGLRVVASAADVSGIEANPNCKVRFNEAVSQAVKAFLSQRSGSGQGGKDAPVDIVLDMPEAHGLPATPTAAQVEDVLRGYLAQDEGAELVLLTPATVQEERYRFTPEYGEALDTHWVFRIILPNTFDIMAWAVVDIEGKAPAYAYGIE